MYTIKQISVDEKKKKYFDVEFYHDKSAKAEWLNIHEDTLVAHQLYKGLEVDEHGFDKIKKRSREEEFYQAVVNYISYRQRSRGEVKAYLYKKGASAETSEAVISRCLAKGLLDDEAFAEMFVRQRKNYSDKGPAYISRELAQKGVSSQSVEKSTSVYTREEQQQKLDKLIRKKMKQKEGKVSTVMLKQQLAYFFLNKGFPGDIVHETIAMIFSETEDDDVLNREWQALVKAGEKAERKYQKEDSKKYKLKMTQYLYRKGFKQDLINQYLNNQSDNEFQ